MSRNIFKQFDEKFQYISDEKWNEIFHKVIESVIILTEKNCFNTI